MKRDDLIDLFTVLQGYWPNSAPDIDNPIDAAAYWQEMANLELDDVTVAVRELARTKEFCPPVGILAEATRRPTPVPPSFTPAELPERTTPTNRDEMIRANFAEARESLKRSAARKSAAGRNP